MVRKARITNESTATKRPLPASVAVVRDQHAETDLVAHLEQYARERPAMVALWCLGVGFVLGWKLKPW
jgi:hypothetical protein